MKSKKTETAAIVALAAAAAAGSAGYYYFYASKGAKKHRQAASKWAVDLKKNVVREAKKMPTVTLATIGPVVEKAAAAYSKAGSVDKKDINAAVKELKRNWRLIAEEVSGGVAKAKKAQKSAAKSAKKAAASAKKAAKKTVKKAKKKTR